MKLITKATAKKLMAAYDHSAKTGEGGKEVLAKFFTPWAGATWYITEGWPVYPDGSPVPKEAPGLEELAADHFDWHLFGFCDLGDSQNAELGYVMLSDLQKLHGPFGLAVERDLYYEGTLDEVLKNYGKAA